MVLDNLHLKILTLSNVGEIPGDCALKGVEILCEQLKEESQVCNGDTLKLVHNINDEILEDFNRDLEPDFDMIINSLNMNLKIPEYTSLYDNTRLPDHTQCSQNPKRQFYMETFFDGESTFGNIPLLTVPRTFLLNSGITHVNHERPDPQKKPIKFESTLDIRVEKKLDPGPAVIQEPAMETPDLEFKPGRESPNQEYKPIRESFNQEFKPVRPIDNFQREQYVEPPKPPPRYYPPDFEKSRTPDYRSPAKRPKKPDKFMPSDANLGFSTGLDYLNNRVKDGVVPAPDFEVNKESPPKSASPPKNPSSLPKYNPASFNNYKPVGVLSKSEVPKLDPKYQALVTGDVTPEIISMVLDMKVLEYRKITKDDIVGLEDVKKLIIDKIVNPILLPELHVGLFKAPKGILLFGPPGTGKTTIAKWIASVSNATFFEISPSSITSKFYGESESIIKTLFKVALVDSPALIFVDEVDAILGKRKSTDDESSVRMKNQLLQMMDGIGTGSNNYDESGREKMVIVVGATNRPHMMDAAALRRFSKRILIGPPDHETRKKFVVDIINKRSSQSCSLSQDDLERLAKSTDGWTGCDLLSLCQKAAEYCYDDTIAAFGGIENVKSFKDFRGVEMRDFERALECTRPSADESIEFFTEWSLKHGSK